MPTARDPLYQRHRFPPEVISHAVWLYFRRLMKRILKSAIIPPRVMITDKPRCATERRGRRWAFKLNIASTKARTIARRTLINRPGGANGS